MHHRNAARVLPVPVGARIKVDSPRAMAGQPAVCGLVGAGKTAENQSHTAGWKRSSESARLALMAETAAVRGDGAVSGASLWRFGKVLGRISLWQKMMR